MDAIDEMTDLEKIHVMQQLWQSLTANKQLPAPPEWHGDVLAKRTNAIHEGKANYTSLADLKERGPLR